MFGARFLVMLVVAAAGGLGMTGCAPRVPRGALAMRPQTIEFRQRSTRRFMTDNEEMVLAACAGVLQDLGFTIDQSETDLGFILASKDRSAVEGKQVAGKILIALLFRTDVPIDRNQKFRASIITRPAGAEVAVRVTFQRIVWNDRNQISKREPLEDAELYREFFARLAKAVFLEAHQI